MRVCFDSLCFASHRLAEDGDEEGHQETTAVAAKNLVVITSEGKIFLTSNDEYFYRCD